MAKKAKTAPVAKKAVEAPKKKRQLPASFKKEFKPSDLLVAVLGRPGNITRQESIKLFWNYVKKNGLQNKREINLDDKLKAVSTGVEGVDVASGKITMFQVAKIISKHLSSI